MAANLSRSRRPCACSDAADATTRTFEARYVLNGALANAPLGSTVTLRIGNDQAPGQVLAVPLASVYDPGNGPGVWRIALVRPPSPGNR